MLMLQTFIFLFIAGLIVFGFIVGVYQQIKDKMVKKSVIKIWGTYEDLLRLHNRVVKILTINPGQKISNQHHLKRSEIWTILSGTGEVCLQDEHSLTILSLQPGTRFEVDVGVWHQVKADDDSTLVVLELQDGESCDENDIIRKEDVL